MNVLDDAPAGGEEVLADAPVEDIAEGAASGEVLTEEVTSDESVRAVRKALFEEKLAGQREKRKAQRLADRAKQAYKAAADERRAAAAERAKYDGLKKGSFKETLTTLGRNPREVWEEMNREAIEANDPEAIAKREKAEQDEKTAKLQARLDAIDAEKAEQAKAEQARAYGKHLASKFMEAAEDPAFKDLRIEYPDHLLLEHAQYYDKHPNELREHARTYGVRLTAPEKGFTMHELLHVLSAAQAAHDTAKQARIAATAPPEAQQAGRTPTVNGTAERRNAGTVTNDLASQRASSGPKVSGSVKERLQRSIDEEIRRSGGG